MTQDEITKIFERASEIHKSVNHLYDDLPYSHHLHVVYKCYKKEIEHFIQSITPTSDMYFPQELVDEYMKYLNK